MLPNTHAYAAKEITGSTNPLIIYGSILPDIAVTRVIKWGVIDQQSEDFLSFITRKNKRLIDLGLGICLHELPIGIDRFTHASYNGKVGYAYHFGKFLLLKHPYLLLAGKKALTVAHNFIETGVEYHLLHDFPKIQQLVRNSVKKVNVKTISKYLADFFKLDREKTLTALCNYNETIIDTDYSSIEGLAEFWSKLITSTGKNVNRRKIVSVIESAIKMTNPTYKEFLAYAISQSKKDYKKFIGYDRFS